MSSAFAGSGVAIANESAKAKRAINDVNMMWRFDGVTRTENFEGNDLESEGRMELRRCPGVE